MSTDNHATEAGIYQSFSGLLLLTNYSKNFYLSWCCLNFQTKSKPFFNKFQNFFKANHKSSVENIHPKLRKNDPIPFKVKICKPLKFFFKIIFCKFAKYFKVQNLKTKKFLKGSKVTRSNAKVEPLPQKVRPSLKSNFFLHF